MHRTTTELLLLDLNTDKVETVCTVPTVNTSDMTGAIRSLRVDGHQCWSRDFEKVSLQGTFRGARQLYVVDMAEWIS